MKNKWLLALAAFGLIIFQSCGSDESSGEGFSEVLPAVEAVQAQFGSLPLEERLNGIVRAANQVDIYPEIAAPIERVFVQNGDQVQQGDVLVQLRDSEYQERLRQAEANLRISVAQEKQALAALGEVESEIKRIRVLAERDMASDLELEQVEAQLESAEANYELAQAREQLCCEHQAWRSQPGGLQSVREWSDHRAAERLRRPAWAVARRRRAQ